MSRWPELEARVRRLELELGAELEGDGITSAAARKRAFRVRNRLASARAELGELEAEARRARRSRVVSGLGELGELELELPGRFGSLEEVRRANASIGGHWFEASSVRFFGSRVADRLELGCFFVSSERRPYSSDPRGWTVRVALPDGSIDSVSEFQGFSSSRAAWSWLRRELAAKGVTLR